MPVLGVGGLFLLFVIFRYFPILLAGRCPVSPGLFSGSQWLSSGGYTSKLGFSGGGALPTEDQNDVGLNLLISSVHRGGMVSLTVIQGQWLIPGQISVGEGGVGGMGWGSHSQ